MNRLLFGFVILTTFVPLTSSAAPTNAAVPTGEPLSLPARRAIALRMVDHSGDLNALMDSMLMLDYQFVEQTARKVAAAPALPRPVHGETNTLSASVPTRFFDLQDLLTKQLKALADAAHARDSVKSAHAFSQITETCVSCHSEFMWQSSGNQH